MKQLNEPALAILTEYYYPRASWLQTNCNWGELSYTGPEANLHVNDELMQQIEIYDCYERQAAGFSNVLQDLHYGTNTPKWHHQSEERHGIIDQYETKNWSIKTWFFVYLAHRITGSGASFVEDHGYRNNAVQHFGAMRDIADMKEFMIEIKASGRPLFTSIGNQPPSPRRGVTCLDFIVNELEPLIDGLLDVLFVSTRPRGHKEVVDFLNEYNLLRGHKRFNFAYAAFAMDVSDYYPELVDPDSHTYLGNNAIRCMKSLSTAYKSDDFMDILVERTGGKPKDLEDVMCDFIRFGQNYVPRSGVTFDHIPSTIHNNSGWESGFEQRQGEQPLLNTLQLI